MEFNSTSIIMSWRPRVCGSNLLLYCFENKIKNQNFLWYYFILGRLYSSILLEVQAQSFQNNNVHHMSLRIFGAFLRLVRILLNFCSTVFHLKFNKLIKRTKQKINFNFNLSFLERWKQYKNNLGKGNH